MTHKFREGDRGRRVREDRITPIEEDTPLFSLADAEQTSEIDHDAFVRLRRECGFHVALLVAERQTEDGTSVSTLIGFGIENEIARAVARAIYTLGPAFAAQVAIYYSALSAPIEGKEGTA